MIALLLFTHFIADFVLQSREMGKKKSYEPFWLFKHLLIQFWMFFAVTAGATGSAWTAWKFAALNALIHGIIDWNIWRLYKLYAYKRIIAQVDKELLDPPGGSTVGVTREQLINSKIATWQYWEDHWFYTTIGFDQLLHMLTLVLLAGVFLS